jgi:hypothetical protein
VVYICVVSGGVYWCCKWSCIFVLYTTTYNTNIHDHIQHKYTRPLTTQIYTTTYNTNIHDHLQHKYTRPLTTQIYTTTYNTYIHDHLQHKYTRSQKTQIYTTTYNTNIHGHIPCIFVLYVVVYICVVSGGVYLRCKWWCIFVL